MKNSHFLRETLLNVSPFAAIESWAFSFEIDQRGFFKHFSPFDYFTSTLLFTLKLDFIEIIALLNYKL